MSKTWDDAMDSLSTVRWLGQEIEINRRIVVEIVEDLGINHNIAGRYNSESLAPYKEQIEAELIKRRLKT